MKIDGKVTGLTTQNLHDGELVIVTLEGPNWSAQAQTKDATIGAEWKAEHEANLAAAKAAAEAVPGTAPVAKSTRTRVAAEG